MEAYLLLRPIKGAFFPIKKNVGSHRAPKPQSLNSIHTGLKNMDTGRGVGGVEGDVKSSWPNMKMENYKALR